MPTPRVSTLLRRRRPPSLPGLPQPHQKLLPQTLPDRLGLGLRPLQPLGLVRVHRPLELSLLRPRLLLRLRGLGPGPLGPLLGLLRYLWFRLLRRLGP